MYSAIHSDGASEANPPVSSLEALLDELRVADREHGDVTIVLEDTGWSLSAHKDGRMVLENLSTGGERHMKPVTRERVLELWRRLIEGDLSGVLGEPWRNGYGS